MLKRKIEPGEHYVFCPRCNKNYTPELFIQIAQNNISGVSVLEVGSGNIRDVEVACCDCGEWKGLSLRYKE